MNKAYLLTGGNIGNRSDNLLTAQILIKQYCGEIVQQSSVYQTQAWGFKDQPYFFNQTLCISTSLLPEQLMETLLEIEEKMGRKREMKNGPRTIDIDILLFNDAIINLPNLTIPHMELQERRFALTPLAEIAGETIHPVIHKTIKQILYECRDTSTVYKTELNIFGQSNFDSSD